jgi:hypothetical protein
MGKSHHEESGTVQRRGEEMKRFIINSSKREAERTD